MESVLLDSQPGWDGTFPGEGDSTASTFSIRDRSRVGSVGRNGSIPATTDTEDLLPPSAAKYPPHYYNHPVRVEHPLPVSRGKEPEGDGAIAERCQPYVTQRITARHVTRITTSLDARQLIHATRPMFFILRSQIHVAWPPVSLDPHPGTSPPAQGAGLSSRREDRITGWLSPTRYPHAPTYYVSISGSDRSVLSFRPLFLYSLRLPNFSRCIPPYSLDASASHSLRAGRESPRRRRLGSPLTSVRFRSPERLDHCGATIREIATPGLTINPPMSVWSVAPAASPTIRTSGVDEISGTNTCAVHKCIGCHSVADSAYAIHPTGHRPVVLVLYPL